MTFKVLIIGLGSIAKKHIVALRKLRPSVEIYALRSGVGAESVVGVKDLFDWSEVVFIPDFVIISSPSAVHSEHIEQANKLRCPLFIEKPPVSDLMAFDALSNRLSETGNATYVGCNLRFRKCLAHVKELLDTEGMRINEVNVYAGSFLPDWRPSDFRKGYSASATLGGGIHLDFYHEFDYLYWFFGAPLQTHKVRTSNSSLEIESVDYANYVFEYKDFSASLILNYYRKIPKRVVEVVTEDHIYAVDIIANNVTCNGELIFESDQSMLDTYEDQMDYFLKRLSSNELFDNSFYNSKPVLEMIAL